MRFGVYLGRHAGSGGGMGVYCRDLVRHLSELLERKENAEDEVVLYGDPTILTPELLTLLDLSPVIATRANAALPFGASYYFARLPNGARSRILIRLLGSRLPRKINALLDQLFVPLLARLDGCEVLHSTANYGFIWDLVPQVVTVHDLYQAWPPSLPKTGQSSLTTLYYRRLFSRQFKLAKYVITDSQETADVIYRTYLFDPARISVIPLGLDDVFMEFWQRANDGKIGDADTWLEEKLLKTGYVLAFASLDPRKNLERTLEAWLSLPEELQARGIVLLAPSKSTRKWIETRLKETPSKKYVRILDWLERDELPYAYYHAGATLVPTIAEGFGFPAIESLSVGTPVISGPIEVLQAGGASVEGVYLCEPTDTGNISEALKMALSAQKPALAHLKKGEKQGNFSCIRPQLNGAPRPRSMSDAMEESFNVYRSAVLRFR